MLPVEEVSLPVEDEPLPVESVVPVPEVRVVPLEEDWAKAAVDAVSAVPASKAIQRVRFMVILLLRVIARGSAPSEAARGGTRRDAVPSPRGLSGEHGVRVRGSLMPQDASNS